MAGVLGLALAGMAPASAGPGDPPPLTPPPVVVAPAEPQHGYRLAGADGGVFAYGETRFLGSMAGVALQGRIVGIAATPLGTGYWLVGSDGGVFAFGDAGFYGSAAGLPLNGPVVGMAVTPSGRGYWLVAADGGVFTFGDARFVGSAGGFSLNGPVVGMASTGTGDGYWLAARDGGVFAFGDAQFRGALRLNPPVPIVGILPGYLLLSQDGILYNPGDPTHPTVDCPRPATTRPLVSVAYDGHGGGFWLVTSNGAVFRCGDAQIFGGLAGVRLAAPIVGMDGN